ncbi:cell wall biogenesis protein-like protein Ecm15 [Mytilinidion resinicola]|uniref:Cell wall biogenesis protein-like protein Ecm15 n=1 Tax=Mytilinidion resinicola TaxID=574789 RepID=A0A6A6Y381_9PEZI|nr:cell wall biogenesis protein-like protein Ecm15 [Mytilinidion resinicola]KAF2803281.1 cell wall biogenesis protein-like protein Ecm15 [Mytilinidion resinicola]
MPSELSNISTPPACIADFCLIPIGTPSASVSKEVAEVQRILKRSGLTYSMHSAGTTLEGSWDEVTKTIGQCHALLHANGVVRIQSDIRIGTRIDKKQTFDDKVAAVRKILESDEKTVGEA